MGIKPLVLATQEEADAARRLMDAVNLHVLVQNADMGRGKDRPGYVAVRLEDGRSDGVLYDTRADAARHQPDPYCFYVKVGRAAMGLREAWTVLMYARQARDNGVIFQNEDPILPHRLELVAGMIPRPAAEAWRHGR